MAFGVFTNCLSSFPPYTGQKWKFLQKNFDIVTTHNHDMLCKACFSPSLCVFHPIWVLGGGGGGAPKGAGRGTTCLCSLPASAAQKWKFPKLIFFIFLPSKMIKYPM